MKAEEILEMFIDTLNDSGSAGVSRDDGADYYQCSCCLNEKKIKGYQVGHASINIIEHAPDCELFNAYQEAIKLLSELS